MHRVERLTAHLAPHGRTQSLHSLLSSARSTDASLATALSPYIRISPEVASALAAGRAVVALESTIISHGMPWPRNLETALAVEAAAREAGAVPATIAILGGVVHIGLEQAELRKLAQLGEKCRKCSRRDLALLLARGEDGATTVSATMLLAHMAGISLFVTGGIGGVHRGVEHTMDISADLFELARTPVAVVCAGVKSILDIPRTLEFLETFGVPVAGFGVEQFPAFFTRDSGIKAPLSVASVQEAAKMVSTSLALGLGGGAVIAVPVPESAAAGGVLIEKATTQALREASEQRVQGRDITPFLLARIAELTGGESLAANIALILNNVKVGSGIAVEMARMKRAQSAAAPAPASSATLGSPAPAASSFSSWPALLSGPLVCGGSNLDLLGRPSPGTKFLLGTSNPGRLQRSWGGVGRNVAEVLGRLRTKPHLLSAVGADDTGSNLLAHAASAGVVTSGVLRSALGNNTSTYMAILDENGDLFTTIADMVVCDEIQPAHLPPLSALRGAPLVVLDGNVSEVFLAAACERAKQAGVPVVFEPTSIEKCTRIIKPLLQGLVTFVTPSAAELLAMYQRVVAVESAAAQATADNSFLGVKRDAFEANNTADVSSLESQARAILMAIASRAQRQQRAVPPVHLVVKRGKKGAMVASMLPSSSSIQLRHLSAGPLPVLVNTSGAGDSLVGATCFSLIAQGSAACAGSDSAALIRAVELGMRAAEMTLASPHSVSQDMTPEALASKQREYEVSIGRSSAGRASSSSASLVNVPLDLAALKLDGRALPVPGMGLRDRSGLESWYCLIARGHDAAGLKALLADNCTFHSPVVHTPQRGSDLVFAYLSAASEVLAPAGGKFQYHREFTSERGAVLEFESVVEGTRINGVDMIEWDEAGKIKDFKVMVRPLKAFQKLHQAMAQKLQENAAKNNP